MSYVSDEADPLLAAIHGCILNDDPLQLAHLCQEDVDLDERFTPEINEQHVGMTPLSLACALNKVQLAEVLLNSGADVNSTFATLNTTALMTSSFHGHVDIVRLLLERGADVRMVDTQQSTALGYAFGGTRNHEVINMLLQSGVDVNQKNMLGMNALLLVAGYGNDTLVQMVLAAGADANATNDFGHTALHLAVVGKKDQLKKFRTGAPESNSLNRRNLDIAMQEWARLNKDKVGGNAAEKQEAFTKVGNCMMSIGQKLEAGDSPDEDEQEVMKRRVEAVWKHRQDRIEEWKQKKKSGALSSLLSCGGGKSKKVTRNNQPTARPYIPSDAEIQNQPQDSNEIKRINDRCARVLSLLIKAGCEIDKTENAFGMTALDMAILNGDVESSAQLVSAGGDPDHLMKMFALSDIYAAIAHANKRELKELLTYDEDLDLNLPFSRFSVTHKSSQGVELPSTEETGDEGLMPIAVAVRTDDVEIVRMLLKAGARIDAIGPAGRAAIHEASGKGLTKMCAFLLTNGASPEQPAPGFLNSTPVVIAAIMRHHRTVELFITRQAKVDKPLSDNTNALLKAASQNDMEMLHILLSADLQVNFIDTNGFMYIMASKYQSRERDATAILQEVQDRIRQLEAEEREKERQRLLAEENRNRILPRPEPVRAPPQPIRPAPVITGNANQPRVAPAMPAVPPSQHVPPTQVAPTQPPQPTYEEESVEESEEESEEEEQPAPPQVQVPPAATVMPVTQQAPAETLLDAVQTVTQNQPVPAQPATGETNIDEEEESEEESSEEEEEEEESEEESEEEEEEQPAVPQQQPPPPATAVPQSPDAGPPPALPSHPPPPPPAGPPPESEEEEESEEETESEEESEEEEESPSPQQQQTQVVKRTMTTETTAGGQTITHTKTTVVTTSQTAAPAMANVEDLDEEEESGSEEETSEDEETSEEEESEEEEVKNNNLTKPMQKLNISQENSKETTI